MPGKLAALMVADDFAGVAASPEELQALLNRVHAYQRLWRIKSNDGKLRIMVVKGKPRRGAPPAPSPTNVQFRWGGPNGAVVPQVQEYTYMGITLHASCTWEAQIRSAMTKAQARANSYAAVLRRRGASAGIKRMVLLALLRPALEWGAQVWRPNRSDLPRLDSLQADLLKAALHCPATTCHSALLLEMGMRPMSMWFDKRVLEMWSRLKQMPDARIVKQVVLGPGAGALPSGGRTGNRQRTWLDHAAEVLHDWGVDVTKASRMSYPQFKRFLNKQSPGVWERRLEAERRGRPGLDAYLSRLAAGQVQLKAPRPYLRGGGACNRGKELILQIRTGSLPLASLTGKFGRKRRDSPNAPAHFCCPVCSGAEETTAHFLLECPTYASERAVLWRRLEEEMEPERWQTLQGMASQDQAFALVADEALGPGFVADIIAPYVYAFFLFNTRRVTC